MNWHLYPNLLPGFWTTSGTNGHRLESPGNRCELVWRVQKFIGRNTCERKGMETGLGRISVRPQCRCDKSLPVQQELWSKDHLQAESCKCPDPSTTSLCAHKLGAARGKYEPSHATLLSHWLEAALRKDDLDLNGDLHPKGANCNESFLKGASGPYISVSVTSGSYPELKFW